MAETIIFFAAIFLVIFPPALALLRTIPERKQAREDRRFREEGERRRREVEQEHAWEENREIDLK